MIITSLLHDTIEDTTLTEDMIAMIFGERVAKMVSILSKDKTKSIREIVNLAFHEKDREVLLVKLFDRVHNVLTLNFKTKEKQLKKAIETVSIFLTLALYLNIDSAKKLIEEICYNIIDPYYKENNCVSSDKHRLSFLDSQNNF